MIEYVAQKYPQYSAFFVGGGGYTLPRQMETVPAGRGRSSSRRSTRA